jgi:hypothetical protein
MKNRSREGQLPGKTPQSGMVNRKAILTVAGRLNGNKLIFLAVRILKESNAEN